MTGLPAGWQATSRTTSSKVVVLASVTTNIRHLFGKIVYLPVFWTLDLTQARVVCIWESWLAEITEDDLVLFETFQCFRKDRVQYKKTSGGVAVDISSQWSDKSSTVFTFSNNGVGCAVIKYHPKLYPYHGTIICFVLIIILACSLMLSYLFLCHHCQIVCALLMTILTTPPLVPYSLRFS